MTFNSPLKACLFDKKYNVSTKKRMFLKKKYACNY